MALKKIAKKAAKAATKPAKTAKKAPAKTSSTSKPAARPAAARKTTAKPAAKKSAVSASKAVKKVPAAKSKVAKTAPATPAKKAAAPVTAAQKSTKKSAMPVNSAAKSPAAAKAAPVTKKAAQRSAGKASDKAGASAPAARAHRPAIAPRPVGKVAVAKEAKPTKMPSKTKFKVVAYKTDKATGRPILPDGYRPGADEEYMGALQTQFFRQRLFQWRGDLVEESKQTIENLKEEVRDVGDEAERATRETENSLELRTRDRYRKLIGKIDSTLKRLDSGEYGYSVDSGEEIGLDRLEARLTAERTIDEQERWEHLQKQIGD